MYTKFTTCLVAVALILTLCITVSTGYADEFSNTKQLA